tara:strand:- start:74 stop:1900 length:1827 start_codon:yes stop_codon:yes gene_type:complete
MALNKDIFLGAGTTLTHIPECDLYLGVGLQDGGAAFNGIATSNIIQVSAGFAANFLLVENLYVGCLVERYSNAATTQLLGVYRITANDSDSITIGETIKPNDNDYFVIKAYGAPTPAPKDSTAKRLLSDQWLGILESATFPTVEPEMKQLNLSLGGSRNYSYQYKGITAIGNGDLSLMANHGSWLYYFLGRCTELTCTTAALGGAIADRFTANASDSGDIMIESVNSSQSAVTSGAIQGFVETGPIFYRTIGTDICPPMADSAVGDLTEVRTLTRPTISSGSITNPITYKFEEANTDHLPSFAMERSDSKLAATNPFRTDTSSITLTSGVTDGTTTITYASNTTVEIGMLISGTGIPTHTRIAEIKSPTSAELTNVATASGSGLSFTVTEDEDNAFIQIARGCRVNTLTMTANENEEVKMQLSLNSRNVHLPKEGEIYDGRRGISNDANFFNYEGETTGANAAQEFREPFFFSDGRFTVLGQEFLKINTLTLTMNNNLQDKRFLGVGSKDIQESIPAQRTYEIAFTGHVTDNALYKALRDDAENITQTIELVFTKPNGEAITLNFTDYMVSANNFPISDDKSALVVEATVMPRNLSLCTVKTHWVLQG